MTGAPVAQPTYDDFYLSVLRAMHRNARPRRYVEIGIWRGESLRLASPSTQVVGIDPKPQITGTLPRRWSVYDQTSDDFFARPDVAGRVGVIDVAFIDGLHHYEQALRDFMHVEAHMAPNGVVLLHDCLPPDARSAGRTVTPGCWAGDVWKVLAILRDHRPDLKVTVAAASPTGLGIITGLDPTSTVLADRFDEIVAGYADLEFARWPEVTPGRWSALAPLFPVFRRPNLRDELVRKSRTARTVLRRRFGHASAPS